MLRALRDRPLLCKKALKTKVIAAMLIGFCCATGNSKPAVPGDATDRADVGRSLPDVLVSALAEIKEKTTIPVLLPTELPRPFGDAKHARVEKVTPAEYAVALYYELDVGDAGFAALFAAKNKFSFYSEELSKVKLTRGVAGFFRPVSCGACVANVWRKQRGTLYQIQLKLPSTLGKKKQQRIITAVANSAIQAGPR